MWSKVPSLLSFCCLLALPTAGYALPDAGKTHFTVLGGAGLGKYTSSLGSDSGWVPGGSGYTSFSVEKAKGNGYFLDGAAVGLFGGSSVLALGRQQTLHKSSLFSGYGYGAGLLAHKDTLGGNQQSSPCGYVKAYSGIQVGNLLFHATAFGMFGARHQSGGVAVGAGFKF